MSIAFGEPLARSGEFCTCDVNPMGLRAESWLLPPFTLPSHLVCIFDNLLSNSGFHFKSLLGASFEDDL